MTNKASKQAIGNIQGVNEKIGVFFKKARQKKAMSIMELSEYAGMKNPEELKQYEEGLKPIPLNVVYSLANVLDIQPDKIVELFYQLCLPKKLKK